MNDTHKNWQTLKKWLRAGSGQPVTFCHGLELEATAADSKTYRVDNDNLDVTISVGHRVKPHPRKRRWRTTCKPELQVRRRGKVASNVRKTYRCEGQNEPAVVKNYLTTAEGSCCSRLSERRRRDRTVASFAMVQLFAMNHLELRDAA